MPNLVMTSIVDCQYGIRKGTGHSGYFPPLLSQPDALITVVIKQALIFVTLLWPKWIWHYVECVIKCLGHPKTGKGYPSILTLCSLPPSSEEFTDNIKCRHHQAILWWYLQLSNPLALHIKEFDWWKDVTKKSLLPVTVKMYM